MVDCRCRITSAKCGIVISVPIIDPQLSSQWIVRAIQVGNLYLPTHSSHNRTCRNGSFLSMTKVERFSQMYLAWKKLTKLLATL